MVSGLIFVAAWFALWGVVILWIMHLIGNRMLRNRQDAERRAQEYSAWREAVLAEMTYEERQEFLLNELLEEQRQGADSTTRAGKAIAGVMIWQSMQGPEG